MNREELLEYTQEAKIGDIRDFAHLVVSILSETQIKKLDQFFIQKPILNYEVNTAETGDEIVVEKDDAPEPDTPEEEEEKEEEFVVPDA